MASWAIYVSPKLSVSSPRFMSVAILCLSSIVVNCKTIMWQLIPSHSLFCIGQRKHDHLLGDGEEYAICMGKSSRESGGGMED